MLVTMPAMTPRSDGAWRMIGSQNVLRSEEHTSELQSLRHLVCRLLLEKKKNVLEQRASEVPLGQQEVPAHDVIVERGQRLEAQRVGTPPGLHDPLPTSDQEPRVGHVHA